MKNVTTKYGDKFFDRRNLRYYTDYEKFYEIHKEEDMDFKSITEEDFKRLKESSNILVKEVLITLTSLINDRFTSKDYIEREKYQRIIDKIILNPKKYGANNKTEAMVLYLLSVDPNFLAISLFNLYNSDMNVLKKEIINKFGVYDNNIINVILFENKFLTSIDPREKDKIKLNANRIIKEKQKSIK